MVFGVNMRFIDKLRKTQYGDLIHNLDLTQIFHEGSPQAIQSAVSRCLKSGDLIRLKRGVYLFGEKYRKRPIVKFALACQLYSPSYISFESALSYHQLIPEAVYTTTSACYLNKIKQFKNEFGEFSYQYIPVKPFFLEVQQLKNNGNNSLIATPLRALYDVIYKRKIIYKSLQDFELDLRIELDELKRVVRNYSKDDLTMLAHLYKSTAVKKTNQLLLRECK